MRWKRHDLIARLQTEIARREQAAEQDNAARRDRAAARRQAHVDRTSPAWLEFAANIGAAVAAGRPVVAEDCPTILREGWTERVPLLLADHWTPTERDADTTELRTLIELLEAATDDEVSLTALERAGIKISRVFRHSA